MLLVFSSLVTDQPDNSITVVLDCVISSDKHTGSLGWTRAGFFNWDGNSRCWILTNPPGWLCHFGCTACYINCPSDGTIRNVRLPTSSRDRCAVDYYDRTMHLRPGLDPVTFLEQLPTDDGSDLFFYGTAGVDPPLVRSNRPTTSMAACIRKWQLTRCNNCNLRPPIYTGRRFLTYYLWFRGSTSFLF